MRLPLLDDERCVQRTILHLEDVSRQLATPTNTIDHSQANQKLHRWLDLLSASWLQLASHSFGAAAHGTEAREPAGWASYLRPDSVGCASTPPLSRGMLVWLTGRRCQILLAQAL